MRIIGSIHEAIPKAQPPAEALLHRALIAVFSISCIAFTFLDQPFQVPDELQHFYRSYALATGQVIAERRGDTVGSELPASLVKTVDAFSKTPALHVPHPWRKLDWNFYARELGRPLEADRREFVAYPDSAIVGPFGYLPQAIGMRIGIALRGSPLLLLYLGRLANMAAAVAIIWFGLSRLAVGRALAATLLMFPTLQAQISSLSSDGMMVALGFAITVLPLSRLGSRTQEMRLLVGVAIIGVLLVTTKAVYITLVLFAAVLLWRRALVRGWCRYPGFAAASVVVIAVSASLIWGGLVEHLLVKSRPIVQAIDPVAQTAFTLEHPFRYLEILVTSMARRTPYFIQSTVGLLGWGTIQIGIPAYLSAAMAVLLALLKRDRPTLAVPEWMSFLAIGIFVASWILIETALYLRWDPVGSARIVGVQGRYFLPVMFVLVLLQNRSDRSWLPEPWLDRALIVLATYPVVAAQATILRIFY